MTEIPQLNDRVRQALEGAGGSVLLALESADMTAETINDHPETTPQTLATLMEVGLVTVEPHTGLITLTPVGKTISLALMAQLAEHPTTFDN